MIWGEFIAGWCNGNIPGLQPGTAGSIPAPAIQEMPDEVPQCGRGSTSPVIWGCGVMAAFPGTRGASSILAISIGCYVTLLITASIGNAERRMTAGQTANF